MTWDSTIDGCPYCKAPPGAPHALGCIGSPYDGATGVVPRVHTSAGSDQVEFAQRLGRRPADHADPVQRAVDDYILMERKARAWDEMREEVLRWAIGRDRDLVLELMGKLVHLAPRPSPTR